MLQQQVGKGHGQIQGLEIASDGPLRRLKRTPFETKSTQAQVDWKEPTRPARLSNRSDEALLPAFRVRSNEYHYHSIRLADNVQPLAPIAMERVQKVVRNRKETKCPGGGSLEQFS